MEVMLTIAPRKTTEGLESATSLGGAPPFAYRVTPVKLRNWELLTADEHKARCYAMNSAIVDNLFERMSFCPLSIPKSRRPIYQSRRHGREDGRLGADLTSS